MLEKISLQFERKKTGTCDEVSVLESTAATQTGQTEGGRDISAARGQTVVPDNAPEYFFVNSSIVLQSSQCKYLLLGMQSPRISGRISGTPSRHSPPRAWCSPVRGRRGTRTAASAGAW